MAEENTDVGAQNPPAEKPDAPSQEVNVNVNQPAESEAEESTDDTEPDPATGQEN